MNAPSITTRAPQPYWNPYVAGLGLGLVLLSAFVIMGRGLGASGAASSVVAATVEAVNPDHARGNNFYAEYLGDGNTNPLLDWLVFEVIGVFAGVGGGMVHDFGDEEVLPGLDEGEVGLVEGAPIAVSVAGTGFDG